MSFSYTREEWNAALSWMAEWCPQGDRTEARRLLKQLGRNGTYDEMQERFARRAAIDAKAATS